MGEEYSGSRYYYDVYITHRGFPTTTDVEEAESIKKYEEKQKKEKANYF